MYKGLVTSLMFGVAVAVGCSQQDRTPATMVPNTGVPDTGVPDTGAPTVSDFTATNDKVLPAPTVVTTREVDGPTLPAVKP